MIQPKRFVGLHAHSGFSRFDGLSLPQAHIDYVLNNEMNAWALTDHGNANGHAHAFTKLSELRKKGRDFRFIPGCEFYVHPNMTEWKREYLAEKERKAAQKKKGKDDDVGSFIEDEDETKKTKWADPVRRRHHLVVLARTQKGLENLYTLITRSYEDDNFYRFPRIDYKMLKEHGEDLIVSTACLGGPLAYQALLGYGDIPWEELLPNVGDDATFERVQRNIADDIDVLVDCIGWKNFFVEVQFNRLGAQHLVNRHLIEAARRAGVQLIATADSHYPGPGLWKDRELYKKLGWMSSDKFEPGMLPQSTDELKAELYPKNAQQMWDAYHDSVNHFSDQVDDWSFYDDQEIADAIERSYDVAHEMIDDPIPDRRVIYPVRTIMGDEWITAPEDEKQREAFRMLVEKVRSGLQMKGLDDDDEYVQRAKEELAVIRDKNFSLYFLTMGRAMEIANENMTVGPGRGSGAGSLVNYLLGITHVDPIKYGLLFARFCSRARVESPDIDVDVSDNDRLKHLLRKEFGDECVIPVSNYNNFALKSLVKDVSKFYGIPFNEVNDATRYVEKDVKKAVLKPGDDKNVFVLKYDDAMKHSKNFREFIERHPRVGEHIENLFEQNKSIGRHAGGVILGDDIGKRMPIIKVRGERQSSWTEGLHFRHLEDRGMLKCDFLGLKTLRFIEHSIRLILDRDWNSRGGMFTVQLGDDTLELYGDQIVRTSNRGDIRTSDITGDDDIIEVPGVWRDPQII